MADYSNSIFLYYSTWYQSYKTHVTSFFLPFLLSGIFTNTMPSSTAQSTLISNTDFPSTRLTAVHHLITIKLTRENYLLWKAQVVPYLRGQHLFQFVDGSSTIPQPTITASSDGASTTIINPEFTQWQLQDQIVLSALISSLSEKVIAHVVRCTTS